MSVRLQRKFNIAVGTLAWMAGFATLGGAVHTAMTPAPHPPAPVAIQQQEIDGASCKSAIEDLGYYVRIENNTKLIAQDTAHNAETSTTADQFVRASLAIELCRPLPLIDFCAGECGGGGAATSLRFTLGVPKGVVAAKPAPAAAPG